MRCVVRGAVLAGLIGAWRVVLAGRDLGVDALATQLVISWRLAHDPHGMRGSMARTSTSCGWRMWIVYHWWASCAEGVDGAVHDEDPRTHERKRAPCGGADSSIWCVSVINWRGSSAG